MSHCTPNPHRSNSGSSQIDPNGSQKNCNDSQENVMEAVTRLSTFADQLQRSIDVQRENMVCISYLCVCQAFTNFFKLLQINLLQRQFRDRDWKEVQRHVLSVKHYFWGKTGEEMGPTTGSSGRESIRPKRSSYLPRNMRRKIEWKWRRLS